VRRNMLHVGGASFNCRVLHALQQSNPEQAVEGRSASDNTDTLPDKCCLIPHMTCPPVCMDVDVFTLSLLTL
jgi:hypothetical protein